MKRLAWLLGLCLCACGPKEIGAGLAAESPKPEVNAADHMRYPATGASGTQKMLYFYNRPEIMTRMKEVQIERFNKRLGITPSPEDPAYRATPKQRSPFRQ